MFVVAGTPVIESPTAWVTTSLPSTVARTMTAFRWVSAMVSRTIFITASALAVGAGDSAGGVAGAQPTTNISSAVVRPRMRRVRSMPDLGRPRWNPAEFGHDRHRLFGWRGGARRVVPRGGRARQSVTI